MAENNRKEDKIAGVVFVIIAVAALIVLFILGGLFIGRNSVRERSPRPLPRTQPTELGTEFAPVPPPSGEVRDPLDQTGGEL